HPASYNRISKTPCSADHCGLMACLGHAPDLCNGNGFLAGCEGRLSERQLHLCISSTRHAYLANDEFAFRPGVLDVLAVRNRTNTFPPEFGEQFVGCPLAVKYYCKTVQQWVCLQFHLRWLSWHRT